MYLNKMLKDKNNLELKDGFYVGPDPLNGTETNIYRIQRKGDTFSAEYWDGFLPIANFEEGAKNFMPLHNPTINSRFLESKIKS